MATCRRIKETKRKKENKKRKSQTVIFRACAETPHAARSLPYLEIKVVSPTSLRTPSFMAIGSGVLFHSRKSDFSYTLHIGLHNRFGLPRNLWLRHFTIVWSYTRRSLSEPIGAPIVGSDKLGLMSSRHTNTPPPPAWWHVTSQQVRFCEISPNLISPNPIS